MRPKPLVFAALLATAASAQVTTSQYDNGRTGANLNETVLTPKNVNSAHFGKVFSLKVDGDVYAQPLFLPAVEVPGKGKHDVIYIATEHDSVYAFDANGKPADPLWRATLLNDGATPVPSRDVQCPFIRPEVGITPTPVIDRQSGTLYVLTRTKEGGGMLGKVRYVQRLHALAITTGAEKFGGPAEIKATAKGRGAGELDGELVFDPLRELPRASLLLANGQVVLTWASSCDVGPYHGWVMSYDTHTLAQSGVFNTSPDAEESGIWQGDTGPAADADGNVYVVTGNGKFDIDGGGRDYGDSVIRLGLDKGGIRVRDFFTPYNQKQLNADDLDLGSGGPILLPDQPGPHPHLLVVGGKGGGIYVLDRDNLGRFQHGSDSQIVQTVPFSWGVYSAFAYWNRHLYVFAANDHLKDFPLTNGTLPRVPAAQSEVKFIDPGATPSISANGARDGIVWVMRSKGWRSPDTPAVLYAFDAANVANELYNSEQNSARDRAGLCLRFNIPTVVNGKVYVAAKGEVDVYGLLPSP